MTRSAAIGVVLAALVALSIATSSGRSADGAATLGHRSLKGQFLVATPRMGDSRFAQSVVYMVDHTPRGAMGFIVNRALGSGPLVEFLKGFGIESEKSDATSASTTAGPFRRAAVSSSIPAITLARAPAGLPSGSP